jgi:hypothetical protein
LREQLLLCLTDLLVDNLRHENKENKEKIRKILVGFMGGEG